MNFSNTIKLAVSTEITLIFMFAYKQQKALPHAEVVSLTLAILRHTCTVFSNVLSQYINFKSHIYEFYVSYYAATHNPTKISNINLALQIFSISLDIWKKKKVYKFTEMWKNLLRKGVKPKVTNKSHVCSFLHTSDTNTQCLSKHIPHGKSADICGILFEGLLGCLPQIFRLFTELCSAAACLVFTSATCPWQNDRAYIYCFTYVSS